MQTNTNDGDIVKICLCDCQNELEHLLFNISFLISLLMCMPNFVCMNKYIEYINNIKRLVNLILMQYITQFRHAWWHMYSFYCIRRRSSSLVVSLFLKSTPNRVYGQTDKLTLEIYNESSKWIMSQSSRNLNLKTVLIYRGELLN